MSKQTLKQGETSNEYYCEDCLSAFEITLEPSVAGASEAHKKAAGFQPKTLNHCPFCGSESIEENA